MMADDYAEQRADHAFIVELLERTAKDVGILMSFLEREVAKDNNDAIATAHLMQYRGEEALKRIEEYRNQHA